MRRTLGSIAVLAVLLLIATAFWPAAVPPMPAPAFIIAQQPAATGLGPMGSAIPPAAQDADSAAVEAKLAKRIDNLNFVEASLQDALDFLSEATEIDILVDRQTLADEGVSVDAPVQLVVTRTRVTARTAFDLLLEPYHLSYTIREGLIQITTANLANEIKVYNVRDLLTDSSVAMAAGPGMPGSMAGGLGGILPARTMGGAPGTAPGGAEGGHAAGMPGGGVGYANYQTSSLAEVIATTIAPDSWNIGGGPGSITEYNGMLVVKNGQAIHSKIRQLLDMMRTASRTPAR